MRHESSRECNRVTRIRPLIRLSAQRSLIALVSLGILVGFGNAGPVVVCLGEDGHMEVIPTSTEHCCECPSNATFHSTDHQCGSCLDIPLPLGGGTKFLPSAGGKLQESKGKAEYIVSSLPLSSIAAGLPEAPPAGTSCADHVPLASLCTVVLLI
jgi:hypothetical protein